MFHIVRVRLVELVDQLEFGVSEEIAINRLGMDAARQGREAGGGGEPLQEISSMVFWFHIVALVLDRGSFRAVAWPAPDQEGALSVQYTFFLLL